MTNPVFTACCFGKLPVYREFLNEDARFQAVEQLEEWFNDGITEAHTQNENWTVGFDARPPVRFFYMPPGQPRVLAGVIRPSFDQVGRRYPFVIAAVGDASNFEGDDAILLPAVFGNFLNHVTAMAMEAVNPNVQLDVLLKQIKNFKIVLDPPSLSAWSQNYLYNQPGHIFWERALGVKDDPRRYLVFENFAAVLKKGVTHQSIALRMPPAKDPGDVGFWSQVSWVLMRRKHGPTMILWDHPGAPDPASCTMIFGDGKLNPSTFRGFLCGKPSDAEGVTDLLNSGADDEERVNSAKSRYADILDNPNLTPSDWLQRLSVRNLV